jgi:hypothetical protein
MQRSEREPNKQPMIFGESAQFVALRRDLLTSPAWLTLSSKAALVLIDYIDRHNKLTTYGRDGHLAARPMLYSFGMCAVAISKNTFYACMRELEEHGFLQPSLVHKRRSGHAAMWIATERWRMWNPDQAQLRLLNAYVTRRSQAIDNPDQQLFPWVTRLQRTPAREFPKSGAPGDPRTNERAAAKGHTPSNGNGIVHISQVTETIREELWNKSDSRHQRQPSRTSFLPDAHLSAATSGKGRRKRSG